MSSSASAILHMGIAILVRNKSGIPVIVIPRRASTAIIPKQTLWQICHEPRMLANPEVLPATLSTRSFPKEDFFPMANDNAHSNWKTSD